MSRRSLVSPSHAREERIRRLESGIVARRRALIANLAAAPRELSRELVTPATLGIAVVVGVLLDRQKALRSLMLMASLQSLSADIIKQLRAEPAA